MTLGAGTKNTLYIYKPLQRLTTKYVCKYVGGSLLISSQPKDVGVPSIRIGNSEGGDWVYKLNLNSGSLSQRLIVKGIPVGAMELVYIRYLGYWGLKPCGFKSHHPYYFNE